MIIFIFEKRTSFSKTYNISLYTLRIRYVIDVFCLEQISSILRGTSEYTERPKPNIFILKNFEFKQKGKYTKFH